MFTFFILIEIPNDQDVSTGTSVIVYRKTLDRAGRGYNMNPGQMDYSRYPGSRNSNYMYNKKRQTSTESNVISGIPQDRIRVLVEKYVYYSLFFCESDACSKILVSSA